MNLSYKILDDLSQQHGDSFYLFDSTKFEQNFDSLLKAFQNYYPRTLIAYSYKTNYTPRLCSIINTKGGHAEVVSEMEYDLALKIGVSPSKIIVNGPYKTKQALEKFLLKGSTVNLDCWNELLLTEEIARSNNQSVLNVGIRCNFQISDSYSSRFGFDIETEQFFETVKRLKGISNIFFTGLHCHFPDRNLESFSTRIDKILALIQEHFINDLKSLDIGGGFFGKMGPELAGQFSSKIPDYTAYAETIAKRIFDFYKDTPEAKKPVLIIEPGTAIVADVMKFVTRVVDIKRTSKKTIAMTSGSKFNLGSFASPLNMPMTPYHPDHIDNCAHKTETFDISGYTCIENDYLYRGFRGQLSEGDYLVFDNVGSYSLVFKPPFILPNVPVLEYTPSKKSFFIIKRKEENDDIFRTFTF
jgi:diaminopimelate decarboxylase